MSERPRNVLFLCTHNLACGILAEALLNHIGQGRFKAFSAGSRPRTNQQPNPLGLQVLKNAGIPTEGLHSKRWDEFGQPDAPRMDLVITVCNDAAREVCPYRPGQPATAHWACADPSATEGSEAQELEAFSGGRGWPCTAGWRCWSACRLKNSNARCCRARPASWHSPRQATANNPRHSLKGLLCPLPC